MRIVVTFNADALNKEIAGLDEVASGAFMTRLVGEMNRLGGEIHNALIEPLKVQTGLHGSTIPRALKDRPASSGNLAYQIVTRGGNISLKYFGPSEGGGGVTAHPRGVSTFYGGAFMTSGRNGARSMAASLNGHVYKPDGGVAPNGRGKARRGSWYRPISKVKSGVYIPNELVRGVTAATFERASVAGLEPMAARVLTIITGGG